MNGSQSVGIRRFCHNHFAVAIMGRTQVYVKLRIVSLSSKSKSINAIVCQLQEEGIKIRRQTVARILKKYKDSGSLADKVSNGRKPILSMEQLNFIDAKMEENDELTAIGEGSSCLLNLHHCFC